MVDEHSPGSTSASEQREMDRPWRIRAALVVVAALSIGGLIGFVIIPLGQKENAHLSMRHAMARAAGLEPGSPAVAQPINTASPIPVSTVSWDPQIMKVLASGNTQHGAALAAQTCAACHGDKGLSQSMAPGPVFPSLAGQSPYAIYKQLHDFRSGARVNPQMTAFAQSLGGRGSCSGRCLLFGCFERICCNRKTGTYRGSRNREARERRRQPPPSSCLPCLPHQ